MATTAISSFHARASLDATEFDRGSKQMASSISAAGRVIDDQWNVISNGAVRAAEKSAAAFAKGGLGPVFEVQPIKQAAVETQKLTIETKKLWAAQVQAKVAANALSASLGAGIGGAGAAINELNRGQMAGSKAASRFGLIMQQSGYQVQDFAVQVAGGQNKLVAFSQQASQMLGFFGPAGAVAGAVLSVGILAARIYDTADAASEAATKFKTLKEATDALSESKRKLALIGKDEFAEMPFFESEATRTKAEYDAIRLQIATKQAQADSLTKRIKELESQGFADSALALSREVRALAPTEADKIAMAAAEDAATQAQIRLGELKEKQFQQDRENENALLDAGVSRISKELTSEFNKAKEIEKLDEFRDKKQKERLEGLVQSMISEIYGVGNLDKTVLGLQNRIPESLQVNTGASALGGVTGSGTAAQTLDIQKRILDGIQTLVRMEQMASSGYN
jgi:2C-methyl-D-erythritol 2,4-cyclodiphosphate synthase